MDKSAGLVSALSGAVSGIVNRFKSRNLPMQLDQGGLKLHNALNATADPGKVTRDLESNGFHSQEDFRQIGLGQKLRKVLDRDPELFRQYSDASGVEGKRISDYWFQNTPDLHGRTFKKKGGLVSAAIRHFNPLKIGLDAVTPPLVNKGTVQFVQDAVAKRNGTLTGGSLPLSASAVKNVALPTATGLAVDQLIDDPTSKVKQDAMGWLQRKLTEPSNSLMHAWKPR